MVRVCLRCVQCFLCHCFVFERTSETGSHSHDLPSKGVYFFSCAKHKHSVRPLLKTLQSCFSSFLLQAHCNVTSYCDLFLYKSFFPSFSPHFSREMYSHETHATSLVFTFFGKVQILCNLHCNCAISSATAHFPATITLCSEQPTHFKRDEASCNFEE